MSPETPYRTLLSLIERQVAYTAGVSFRILSVALHSSMGDMAPPGMVTCHLYPLSRLRGLGRVDTITSIRLNTSYRGRDGARSITARARWGLAMESRPLLPPLLVHLLLSLFLRRLV